MISTVESVRAANRYLSRRKKARFFDLYFTEDIESYIELQALINAMKTVGEATIWKERYKKIKEK
jgi:hypothetical protein